MSSYLELHVKGGGCALVECGMIGAVMAKGHDTWKVGTPDVPTVIILRSGATIEVIGTSPGGVVGRMVAARQAEKHFRSEGREVYVDWLTPPPAGETDAASTQPPRD